MDRRGRVLREREPARRGLPARIRSARRRVDLEAAGDRCRGLVRSLRGVPRAGRMTFTSPLLLLSLLVVPAALVFLIAVRRRPSRHALAFTNVELLAELIEPHPARRHWVPVALLLVALAAAAVATARPAVRLSSPVDNATI